MVLKSIRTLTITWEEGKKRKKKKEIPKITVLRIESQTLRIQYSMIAKCKRSHREDATKKYRGKSSGVKGECASWIGVEGFWKAWHRSIYLLLYHFRFSKHYPLQCPGKMAGGDHGPSTSTSLPALILTLLVSCWPVASGTTGHLWKFFFLLHGVSFM